MGVGIGMGMGMMTPKPHLTSSKIESVLGSVSIGSCVLRPLPPLAAAAAATPDGRLFLLCHACLPASRGICLAFTIFATSYF